MTEAQLSTTPLATTTNAARPAQLVNVSRLWAPANPGVELTVVVPFYNPGAALRPTVERLIESLDAERVAFEIVAVSDGSTDGSADTLAGLDRVRVVVSPVNQGKGAALHLGFAAARGAWIGFVDADGDIDPRHLATFLAQAKAGNHAGVYADKRHEASVSASSPFRKLVSLFYSTLVSLLFVLGIRDTQTGCKVLRRDVLADLLPRLRERRFAFDLEFFVAAKAAGIRDFHAAPVRLEERVAGSTVTSKAILRTIRDTFGIFVRLHTTTQYAPAATAGPALVSTSPVFAKAA
jgi:glycosyltransferase involved in cell wall biosynthesis